MKFYTNDHPFYCGIDLHSRILYLCILDDERKTVLHQQIKADKKQLLNLLEPYIGNVVIGVECMHCWYWVSPKPNSLVKSIIYHHLSVSFLTMTMPS